MSYQLGPLVRLEGVTISRLPLGGKGIEPSNRASNEKFSDGSGSTAAPKLTTFITDIITESVPFIDGVAPKDGSSPTWKSKGSPKTYGSSEAPVHLYEKVVSGKEIDKIEGLNSLHADRKDETWFCRRSCHKNATQTGTASWDEFTHSFKEHHAETEDAFTPTVIGAREAIKWNTSGIEVEAHGQKWANITLVVEEMKHRIDPKPLKNRAFPVVQLAAQLVDSKEFLVVSVPVVDFEKSPYAEFARDKTLVNAAYVSVERIRELPSNGDIEWVMATASNAGGVLPQWVQNLAVPAAIAKDVEMFMSWIRKQRTDEAPQSTSPSAVEQSSYPATSRDIEKPRVLRADSMNKVLPAPPVQ